MAGVITTGTLPKLLQGGGKKMRKSQKLRESDAKPGKGRLKSKPSVKGGAAPKRERKQKRERKGGY